MMLALGDAPLIARGKEETRGVIASEEDLDAQIAWAHWWALVRDGRFADGPLILDENDCRCGVVPASRYSWDGLLKLFH